MNAEGNTTFKRTLAFGEKKVMVLRLNVKEALSAMFSSIEIFIEPEFNDGQLTLEGKNEYYSLYFSIFLKFLKIIQIQT